MPWERIEVEHPLPGDPSLLELRRIREPDRASRRSACRGGRRHPRSIRGWRTRTSTTSAALGADPSLTIRARRRQPGLDGLECRSLRTGRGVRRQWARGINASLEEPGETMSSLMAARPPRRRWRVRPLWPPASMIRTACNTSRSSRAPRGRRRAARGSPHPRGRRGGARSRAPRAPTMRVMCRGAPSRSPVALRATRGSARYGSTLAGSQQTGARPRRRRGASSGPSAPAPTRSPAPRTPADRRRESDVDTWLAARFGRGIDRARLGAVTS